LNGSSKNQNNKDPNQLSEIEVHGLANSISAKSLITPKMQSIV
jgi:hypothetical protein